MPETANPPIPVADSSHLERVRRLAGYVKRAQEALRGATESRDGAILAANEAGWSIAELARTAGLSEVTVLRICANRAAQRAAAAGTEG